MIGSQGRLIGRIQQKLQSYEAGHGPGRPSPRDIAELAARVQRLRAIGPPFAQVRLSRYITCEDVREVPNRVGGECVATEA